MKEKQQIQQIQAFSLPETKAQFQPQLQHQFPTSGKMQTMSSVSTQTEPHLQLQTQPQIKASSPSCQGLAHNTVTSSRRGAKEGYKDPNSNVIKRVPLLPGATDALSGPNISATFVASQISSIFDNPSKQITVRKFSNDTVVSSHLKSEVILLTPGNVILPSNPLRPKTAMTRIPEVDEAVQHARDCSKDNMDDRMNDITELIKDEMGIQPMSKPTDVNMPMKLKMTKSTSCFELVDDIQDISVHLDDNVSIPIADVNQR